MDVFKAVRNSNAKFSFEKPRSCGDIGRVGVEDNVVSFINVLDCVGLAASNRNHIKSCVCTIVMILKSMRNSRNHDGSVRWHLKLARKSEVSKTIQNLKNAKDKKISK